MGQQAHFLVWYKRRRVGVISGVAAAQEVTARDEFFGITNANREACRNGIVQNSVFRFVTRKKQLGLGSQIVALWRKVVIYVWEYLYGIRVYGFETFVEETETRKGFLYRGDGWTQAGKTSSSPPKLLYCKWREGFSTPVELVYTSSWRGETFEEKRRAKTLTKRRAFFMNKVFFMHDGKVAICPLSVLNSKNLRVFYETQTPERWARKIAWLEKSWMQSEGTSTAAH